MPAFKNSGGLEFLVTIDAPKIREVRQELKIDLADPTGKVFDQLAADPVLLVDCLWVLCRGQNALSDVQFGQSLGGDSLEAAATALTAAAHDFFPQRQRSLLRCLDEKQTDLRQKAAELAIAKINDPLLEETFLAKVKIELMEGLNKLLGRPQATAQNHSTGASGATSSPESAESAPPA